MKILADDEWKDMKEILQHIKSTYKNRVEIVLLNKDSNFLERATGFEPATSTLEG